MLFLPPYSPELNPIEQQFKQYSKEVLELGTFSSKIELLEAISAWERYYNTLRSQIFPSGGESKYLASNVMRSKSSREIKVYIQAIFCNLNENC